MRVFLGHCYYRTSAPSGEDIVFRSERALLESRGVEVLPYEKFNDELDTETLLDRFEIAKACIWSKTAYREVRELIRDVKPDVAHFHNTFPQMSPSVYKACRDLGIPVVQTLHNYRLICPGALLQREGAPCELCLTGSIVNSVRYKCYRQSYLATAPIASMISLNRLIGSYQENVQCYIALTEFAKGRLIAGGLPENRIVVKPNFIEDPGQSAPSVGQYVVFVGRLTQEKGVRTLVRAWRKLCDIPLKIVGDGDLRSELEDFTSRHELPIEFVGHKSKEGVRAAIRNARFQIVPSECYEGFPLAILEAFAHSKCVLASRIGSLKDLIVPGVDGGLFDPWDEGALGREVRNLWALGASITALGANARRRFESKYTADKCFSALMDIYQSATHFADRKSKLNVV